MNMKKRILSAIAFALAASVSFAAPQKAADISVSGYTGSTTLENFPVLVRISPTRISGFAYADCASNGADISFKDASGNALDFEIDTWDTSGDSLVWVKVPSLSGSATTITLRWKDASPASHTPSDTWGGYTGVWHLNEPTGGITTISDSTANALSGTSVATSLSKTDGKVGRARYITDNEANAAGSPYDSGITVDMTGDADKLAAINDLIPEFTASFWVRPQRTTPRWWYFITRKGADAGPGWGLQQGSDSDWKRFRAYGGKETDSGVMALDASSGLANGTWTKVDAVWFADKRFHLYMNGAKVGEGTLANQAANGNKTKLAIGGALAPDSGKSGRGVKGDMDEVRLRKGALSPDWIAADYAQVNTASFITYGSAYSPDGVLNVSGAPAEIGSPTPAYGQVRNLAVNDTVTLSMAATSVAGEGTVTNFLKGWKLETVNPDTGACTLLRSSSDTNEVIYRCDYVHTPYAEFTWLWDVRDTLGVGTPSVVSKGQNVITLSAAVTGIGYTAPSAKLKFAYGPSPDALLYTNVVSPSVTAPGQIQGTISRLVPGSAYYIQAVIETNDGAHDVAASEAICVQTDTLFENGEPGLWQTYFTSANANWAKDVWSLPEGEDWLNYTDANRIRRRELGPIAAYACTKTATLTAQYSSEIWGDKVYWPGVNNGQFAYVGHIYLQDGKSYKFRTTIDDNELVKITDAGTGEATSLINQTGSGNGTLTSPAFTPSVSGWHAIEVRFSDGSGDRGGCNNGDGYKNTTNLGFSQDNGSTWSLLIDPGDGSLLRASPNAQGGSTITASEVIANNALASVALSFDAAESARALRAAWGPAHGGNDPAGWLATSAVTTVAADATSASWTPPVDWGSDSNLVVRFYFDAVPPEWSNSIFWHDYSAPSVTGVAADGTGGDTLVVSGALASFPGADCTLSVYTGDSPTTLTNAWTGLAGSVRTATGDFSLSLFEPDTTATRYLAPGSIVYVAVEASSEGRVSRTEPVAVTLRSAPVFASSSSSVSRRTVTFTGRFSDPGAGSSATVRLYVGTASAADEDLVAVEDPVIATNTASFSIVHTFADFETSYRWQFRATAATAGGTETFETRTSAATVTTLDTTTYTWKTSVTSGNWSDAANWTDNQNGDSLGYPQSANATVVFPAGTVAEVSFTEALTVGTVTMTADDLELTFSQGGASTNATKLTSSNFNPNGKGGCITLDGVAVASGSNMDMGAGRALKVLNGANLNIKILYQDEGQEVLVSGGSWLACTENDFGIGTFTIDDSTFWTTANNHVGRTRTGGHVIIKGTHPLWYHAGVWNSFFSYIANANVQLDFLVPVGGYAAAPIQAIDTQKYYMGNNSGNPGQSTITVNVPDESPANFADATVTSPLISWPHGINKNILLTGHLPAYGAATDDAFVWGDDSDYPALLSVTIVGSSHAGQIQVTGVPEAVESADLSPSYGYTALAENASRTFTAPSDYVSLSETKRALCTGWKLYDVNASTLARTLVDSNDVATATLTGTGLWQELEWQWRIEYKVDVTAGAGGTAAASEIWVADGASVTVSATPDAGYGFAKWSGDVTDEDRMKSSFSFTVDGQAYALTASFNAAYYVATDGNDNNDGLSAATPLATIAEALDRGALQIYVAEGVYDITNTLVVNTATTIEGLGENRGAVIRYAKLIGGYSSAYVIELLHNDAALRNLAVTTAANDSKYSYVRGVSMTGGLIDNCSITNCIVSNGSYKSGGGVNMSGGILRNSLLDGNSIYGAGGLKTYGGNISASGGLVDSCVIRRGGARNRTNLYYAGIQATGGTVIRNCLIEGNKAADGGGFAVYLKNATMENCTVVANSAPNSTSGSALYIEADNNNPVFVRNTIIWGNTTAGGLGNWAIKNTTGSTIERVVTSPVITGTANTDADPLFRDFENGDYHPTLGSARNAGVTLDWMDLATDIDGNPRIAEGAPDIGCHEYVPAALDCSFDVAAVGALDSDAVTITATVVGADLSGLVYSWTITDQDGNETARSGADLATLTLTLGPGVYSIALQVENGAHDTASYARNDVVTVYPSHIYVDVNGANAMPFASYANGATNILDAVAFATDGTTIHVADGFYRYDSEIVLNDAIRIVSENGPTNTAFFCSRAPLGLRSVNLANSGAVVSGIAITGIDTDNPASGTHPLYSFVLRTDSGAGKGLGARPSIGGVRITSAGGTVTNCFIVNHRGSTGAGATIAGGTVVDCLFTNNWTYCTGGSGQAGGGVHVDGSNALVDRCTFLSNCVFYGGTSYGGGANVNSGTLRNCLFVGNQCTSGYGGNLAVRNSSAKVYHCTSVKGYGSLGNGGIYYSGGTLADCISYDNVGNGIAEDTEDPGFIDYPGNDFHLSNASPAVDAATSGMGGDLDLDHAPRVSGPAADKGCYEYDKSQFDIGISYSSESFFSDTPVILDAIATPEGTLLDEAQTWWTFDGTEPSASNHDAVGSSVTNLFDLGTWTVRFKTVYNGQSYTVDKPEWFTRYGRTVYLVQENPGAAFPYGTPETAATNLSAAVLSAMDGATVLVGDGTFMCNDGVKYVGRNLVVRSQNGPGRTTFDAAGKNAMFFIRSGDWRVVIDGIRFVNGSGYVDGGAIRINDADSLITNCVFDSCHASAYGGGGVSADAGTIVDCLFTNCWCGNGNAPVGAVIRALGANCFIDRCILLDSHYVHDASAVTRSALYVNNGTVRNTVVARSRLTGEGGILAAGSAKVQNCTVVDNVSEHTGYVAGIKVEGSATVKNTIIWNNANEADGVSADIGGDTSRFDHYFTDDPGFVGKRGREFLLRSNSPCRDAGVVESWMNGALDVYRQPRIDNPKHSVDIGASECQRTDGTMLIMR